MNIGENIKKIRKEKGLTQKDLATSLDVSTITIQNYENNRREPRLETLNKIASILECDLYELMGLTETLAKIDAEIDKYEKLAVLHEKDRPIETASLKNFDKNSIKELLTSTVIDMMFLSKDSSCLYYDIDSFSNSELEEIGNFIYIAYDLKVAEILDRHKSKNTIVNSNKKPVTSKKEEK
ncbi:helix-turn-helix domain-containing protein [Clostridium sardiniense]|uniref:helix-turn-helix domain-containing protein n=1 Tax=Clostridium sardiniense TaxID=29369 RepID=UPI00195D7E2E|nr:helix-turn-helix transcriptional regulator [Clostridium sardiniense]MBM7834983.1 transcriptional regulator with XRE-family HTH domain [Clostridium sardiniense]